MILTLRCPNGHTRQIPNVTTQQESNLLRACVKARLARCDVCARPIVRCEEEKPS